MNPRGSPSDPSFRLKAFLKETGLHSNRIDSGYRAVKFVGRSREWVMAVQLTPEWLNVATAICEVPKEPGLRARLFEWAMEKNRAIALGKFGIRGAVLLLEADYRSEHVDATVLGRMIGYLYSVVEGEYPQVFRIVNGDDVLESLEASMSQGGSS